MPDTSKFGVDETTVYIDLSAIQHNCQIARELAPKAQLLAMVKANAYGHGMHQTAAALQKFADYFGVARMSEAMRLRESGCQKPIVILSELLNSNKLDIAKDQHFTPVIFADSNYRALVEYAERIELAYWLKLDTGMHRLGLCTLNTGWVNALQHCTSVITHFHSADSDPLSIKDQLKQFNQLTKTSTLPVSLNNSASLLDSNSSNEIVRPGIMLYGCDPRLDHEVDSLRKAMFFYAPIIDLHEIPAGDGVGYNHRWRATRPSTIATIAAGYGDGYPRQAGSGTPVAIHGKRSPLVGTVSMDMITVDVTEITEAGQSLSIGDTAELWGDQIDVSEVANKSNTISYDLLTGITSRVKRKYSSD